VEIYLNIFLISLLTLKFSLELGLFAVDKCERGCKVVCVASEREKEKNAIPLWQKVGEDGKCMDLLNRTGHSAPMVIFKTAGRLAHEMTSNYEGRVIAFIPRDWEINFIATLDEINCPEILIEPLQPHKHVVHINAYLH